MNTPLTPVMEQYWKAKSLHPDKIVLFQMGDFFEMFYKDAEIAAPILNIALTSRNKKAKNPVSMCGIPLHAMPKTVGELLKARHKVAICEQIENPNKKKGLVERKVTRVLSPGITYDPSLLDELKAHYLCAFDDQTVSFVDQTTGEAFNYSFSSKEEGHRLIFLIQPVEVIFGETQKKWLPRNLENTFFSLHNDCEDLPSTHLPESSRRLLSYIKSTGGEKLLKNLRPFENKYSEGELMISELTHKHLETIQNFEGKSKGSLFSAINRTVTAGGGRELKKRLLSPLTQVQFIEQRLDRVAFFTQKSSSLNPIRKLLTQVGDLERSCGKISGPSVNARDILNLGHSLNNSLKLLDYDPHLKETINNFQNTIENLSQKIIRFISPEAPLSLKEGRLFNKNVDKELDSLIEWSENSQKIIEKLEIQEREKTLIPSLKIRCNQVFGYYIEVTKFHTKKVPSHYLRKQTLSQAERYTTEELSRLEEKIALSLAKRAEKEYHKFQELLDEVYSAFPLIHQMSRAVNNLDLSSSLAFLALERGYSRPAFSNSLSLVNSRHPVIEQVRDFVPNTVSMEKGKCLLLTGPNMAGKSTLMRQVALNVMLAQAGSFVAAESAELPVFKKIFTRIGSNDLLHSGLSTFMVEMKEAAAIVQNADENSLVILDELGRGTSTYDGLSLAWSLLEYLVSHNKSLIFFSTHYHELTQMKDSKIKQGSMAVQESSGNIDFLYTLKEGSSLRSYGIDVGEKAGLPSKVIQRARQLMEKFEKRSSKESSHHLSL